MPSVTATGNPVILNITNGDAAAQIIRQSRLHGEVLAWDDVLHEGPVPPGTLADLTKNRARHIHECGWEREKAALHRFRERNRILQTWDFYDRILLWFEHDLYDQLQLLQILDYFHHQTKARQRLWLINTNRYLGTLSTDEMEKLLIDVRPVSPGQLNLANRAWSAFRKPTPEMLHRLLLDDLDELPWLHLAIIRLFEEYPSCSNGLSRTERQLLEAVASGEKRLDRVFEMNQQRELARFMGDASVERLIRAMLGGERPLLKNTGEPVSRPFNSRQQLELTEAGMDVLECRSNLLEEEPIDRWIGGVHITQKNQWCYDASYHQVKRFALAIT
jgi:hypothetical protein